MVGFIVLIIIFIIYFCGTASYGFHKAVDRSKALSEGKEYYTDDYGKDYDVKTCRQVFLTYDSNGDRVMKDVKNGKIYKNYSEEKRNQYDIETRDELIKINEENKKYNIQLLSLNDYKDKWGYNNYRWLDLETNKICILMKLGWNYFLVDENTFQFVRFIHEDFRCYSYDDVMKRVNGICGNNVKNLYVDGVKIWTGDLK